jgi:glycosyltransferase involved in cell wall biosynthesis
VLSGRPVLGVVLKGYPRISETFISNEILLLEQLGFAVHIISMRPGRERVTHASVRRIRARVDYLPETFLRNPHRLLFHGACMALRRPGPAASGLALTLRRYRRTRNTASFRHYLQAAYLVNRWLPGSGIVHLHAHFAHSPTSVALYASTLSGLPFSFTAHAKDIYTSDPEQLREKIAHARFVVTCTEHNRTYLSNVAQGLSTPIHRVYHGIDTGLFAAGERDRCAPRPPYRVLTVARLIAKKGIPTVLQAVKTLVDSGVQLTYTLIGDGQDRERVLARVRELGLEAHCRWLGTQPHEVVLDHYRRADLFVLGCEVAEDGDRDGVPNVLFESMAMGVPVVATDVSAIPELVVPEETGLLVPPRRHQAMADAMRRLLTDRLLRRQVIPAARARVLADFDNRALTGRLAEILRPAVGGPSQPFPCSRGWASQRAAVSACSSRK